MPSPAPTWVGCHPGNFRAGRPAPYKPEAIVLHVSTGSLASADTWFNNPAAQVSAHYIVGKTGEVHQYVHETDTAFHAGTVVLPTWPLLKPNVNPNFYTVGIEHEGQSGDIVTSAQLAASTALVQDIAHRWTIPLDLEHLISHHQIRASKPCPGGSILPHLWLSTIAGSSVQPETPDGALVVQTTSAVNLRQAATASAPVLRVLPQGSRLTISGRVNGQAVQGNSSWYALAGGAGFVWSGATEQVTAR